MKPSAKRVAAKFARRASWVPEAELYDAAKDPGKHDPIPEPEEPGSRMPTPNQEGGGKTGNP